MMKLSMIGAAALLLVATAAPVLAQDRDARFNHDSNAYNRPYQRDTRIVHRSYNGNPRGHAWREGDSWNGHRVSYRSGRWGYYQPRNGTQVFVQFSL